MPDTNTISTFLPSAGQGQSIPAAVKAKLLAAQLIQEKAANPTPVYHPAAGAAYLAAGLMGGLMEGQEYRKAAQGQADAADQAVRLGNALRQHGQQPAAPAGAQAAPPAPSSAWRPSEKPVSANLLAT